MSLLGIDVGTTGCKAAAFSLDGRLLASAYAEYDIRRPQPGYAELDTRAVWERIQQTIRRVAVATRHDPIQALAVSSLGEAMVPVSEERGILGPSILNFDLRGEEYLERFRAALPDAQLYAINGNTWGNHYSLTKLKWLQEHQPALYEQTYRFLLWSGFVSFMLGAEPAVDYSLANRTLLFDLDRGTWSDELLSLAGLEREKLPTPVPSGTVIGAVAQAPAEELGLPVGAAIVSGAHDQCANAVGCGAIEEGQAVFGMGTFLCITPVFRRRRDPALMIGRGLNTEHHAVPDRYVCFLYNQGGSLVKWYRDTFAGREQEEAEREGRDLYPALFAEISPEPAPVIVLPHFAVTGPPSFIADSCGVIVGLRLETRRADILKGILEGTTFYLKECVDALPPTGIAIHDYRAVGGGSKSDLWVQLCADILGQPLARPRITEAGTLGAAIIAGVGAGVFSSFEEAVEQMVRLERRFEPDPGRHAVYQHRYAQYRSLYPTLASYLRDFVSGPAQEISNRPEAETASEQE